MHSHMAATDIKEELKKKDDCDLCFTFCKFSNFPDTMPSFIWHRNFKTPILIQVNCRSTQSGNLKNIYIYMFDFTLIQESCSLCN